jgi:hypothetical protein
VPDERLPAKGNIRFRYYPLNGFANPAWPTATELNAGQELEGLTLWESFEIGAQASETSDSASIKAKTTVARRAAANYGGSASFWYPGDHTDMSNLASLVLAIMKKVNQPGFLAVSIDGEIGEAGQPNVNFTFANGEYVSIFRIMTDEWDDMITGEEAFYYTRNFIKNGFMRTYSVVSTSAPVLTVGSPTATVAAATPLAAIVASVNGRNWTRGCKYVSANPAAATVSQSGIITRAGAGSSVITVSLPGTSPAVTASVTVTAT